MSTWAHLTLLAGLEWRPFDAEDWMTFAGAGDHAHVAERDGVIYVRSEEEGQLVIDAFDEEEKNVASYLFEASK